MIDCSEIEKHAMEDAGALGGAYLEEIKKTDLMQLTQDEWRTFIKTVCGGYVASLDDMREQAIKAAQKAELKPELAAYEAQRMKAYDGPIPF